MLGLVYFFQLQSQNILRKHPKTVSCFLELNPKPFGLASKISSNKHNQVESSLGSKNFYWVERDNEIVGHEVKIKRSDKAKESEHSKELSGENPTSESAIVEINERKQIFIAKSKDVRRAYGFTNDLNLTLFSVSYFV